LYSRYKLCIFLKRLKYCFNISKLLPICRSNLKLFNSFLFITSIFKYSTRIFSITNYSKSRVLSSINIVVNCFCCIFSSILLLNLLKRLYNPKNKYSKLCNNSRCSRKYNFLLFVFGDSIKEYYSIFIYT
jgi:hypothetical protein